MPLTPGLRVLRAHNPSPMTLDGTRTYVVGHRVPAVIDPGPALPDHLDALCRALGGAAPAILLTHSHPDHAGAAAALAARTGGRVLAYPGVRDGSRVGTDAGELEVVHTPGHTPDHLAFRWPSPREGDALFVGDAFMGGLDTVLVAPPEGDLAAYLRTLDRVEELAPATLYPAHGDPIADGAAAARRYRAHREERIAQVVRAASGSEGFGIADLVDAVYGPGLEPELRAAAAASIRAIAEYLAATGQARLRPGGGFELPG